MVPRARRALAELDVAGGRARAVRDAEGRVGVRRGQSAGRRAIRDLGTALAAVLFSQASYQAEPPAAGGKGHAMRRPAIGPRPRGAGRGSEGRSTNAMRATPTAVVASYQEGLWACQGPC